VIRVVQIKSVYKMTVKAPGKAPLDPPERRLTPKWMLETYIFWDGWWMVLAQNRVCWSDFLLAMYKIRVVL